MGKAEGGSKADTAVKLVLIFFISLLSFSVGTYVGKQVSDSDFHRAALEVDYNHGTAEASAGHAEGEKAEGTAENADPKAAAAGEEASTKPITEEEVSNLAEEFIKTEGRKPAAAEGAEKTAEASAENKAEKSNEKEEGPSAEGYTHRSKAKAEVAESMTKKVMADHDAAMKKAPEGKKVAAAEKMAPEATTGAVPKAAARVANDMAPAADHKTVVKAAAALPTVATSAIGKYTVQVASFATETEAKERASELTEKGYNAFFVPAQVGSKTWYRVSVGLFSDQKSAANYRTELLATQIVSTAIVQKIVK